jgi:hypothetical protein
MNRRTVCLPVCVGILLLVCLWGGSGPSALADLPNQGTPRPMYATGFTPGTRVELLDDATDLDPALKAGMSGIILCCDSNDCSGSILVSWYLWRGGRDDEAACATALAGLYPPGSAIWVDPSKVRLAVPFEATGVIRAGDPGCLYLATESGKSYHLVIGPEFTAQWWTVLPGAFLRVRGLLNTSPSTDVCAQNDGDVYHPIIAPPSWSTERNSWDRGPFFSGDRVVLVGESDPYGAPALPRGATGTVICRDSLVTRSVLVSWDLWNSRGDTSADGNDYDACLDRISGMYPPGSAWWVAPIDLARYFESDCGTLEQTVLCCGKDCPDAGLVGLFVPFQNPYCLPDISVDDPLPTGLVKAIGLYTPYEALLDPTAAPTSSALATSAGIILEALVTTCHIPNCCDPPYSVGDRVQLLVNQPGGAEGLSVGHGGTVVCCNPNDPVTPILVSWDGWTQGGDDDELCQTEPPLYRENSAFWMACTEIKHVTLPDLRDEAAYRQFLPQTIAVGKHLKISGVITNSGGANSGSFIVSIYLSTDDKLSSSDYLLGTVVYNLDAGGEAALSWINPVPASVAPGVYYVGWVIDSGNQVKEADETNNTVVLDGQLTVTAP